jgi:hypothetical protein
VADFGACTNTENLYLILGYLPSYLALFIQPLHITIVYSKLTLILSSCKKKLRNRAKSVRISVVGAGCQNRPLFSPT